MARILYKHRTRGQAVEAVHIEGMAGGFRSHGYNVDFSSPPLVQLGSSHQSVFNNIFRLISLNLPTIVYEIITLLYNIVSYTKSRQLLKMNTYDFIYERYAFFDFSTIFLKKKYKIPVVLEVNGAVNNRRDTTHGRKIFMKGLAGCLEKKVLNEVDLIVSISTSLKNSLIDIGVKEKKILVLPNAIDPKLFNSKLCTQEIRKKYGLEGKIIVGFIGSFHPWHGVYFLVKSLSSLLRSRKDVHLLLIGKGQERKYVEKLIRDLKLQNSVTFTGFVSHLHIPKHILAMDICTVPNSNDFMSPVKLFEYMAMCKPVVSPRYGPVEEIIEDGKTGLLFRPLSQEQFIDKICVLINNHDLSRKIGKEGYHKVLKEHTWEKNVEKVLEAYIKTKEMKERRSL